MITACYISMSKDSSKNAIVESKNKKLVSLSDDKLLDLGSVIPLLEY